MKNKCTNCKKQIGKIGLMSPSGNPKERNVCMKCAKKLFLYKEKTLEELIEVIFDEYSSHEDCDYDIGCIATSDSLRKKFTEIIKKAKQEGYYEGFGDANENMRKNILPKAEENTKQRTIKQALEAGYDEKFKAYSPDHVLDWLIRNEN